MFARRFSVQQVSDSCFGSTQEPKKKKTKKQKTQATKSASKSYFSSTLQENSVAETGGQRKKVPSHRGMPGCRSDSSSLWKQPKGLHDTCCSCGALTRRGHTSLRLSRTTSIADCRFGQRGQYEARQIAEAKSFSGIYL